MRMFRTYFGRLLGAGGRVSGTEHARAPACALGAVGSKPAEFRTATASTVTAAVVSLLRTTLSDQGDDLLLARIAVAGAERVLELPLELSRGLQLLGDVRAADQLALDEDLRDRRPARLRL